MGCMGHFLTVLEGCALHYLLDASSLGDLGSCQILFDFSGPVGLGMAWHHPHSDAMHMVAACSSDNA